MTSPTRLRLAKEARALLPFWAAIAGLMFVPFLSQGVVGPVVSYIVYIFGCALLGSVGIGHEFQHRTLGYLLTQPISRRRLWSEKLSALAVALLGLLLVRLGLGLTALDDSDSDFPHRRVLFHLDAYLLLPSLLSLCTGPVLTLLARGTIGGMTLMFVCPYGLLTLGVQFPLKMFPGQPMPDILYRATMVTSILYSGALLLLGYWCFQRWEDSHGAQEVSLPAPVMRAFAWLADQVMPARGGVVIQLIRKELRLHLTAYLMAGLLIVLWLLLVAVGFILPSWNKEILLLPSLLLSVTIPLIVGVGSTAEERGMGLLDWHLTLPVSARRQWFIKLLAALVVNGVLSILLPGFLVHWAGGMFNETHLLEDNFDGPQLFLFLNLGLFCAALYASTVSANGIRAIVGAIVLFIAGSVVCFHFDKQLPSQALVLTPLAESLVQVFLRLPRIGSLYFDFWTTNSHLNAVIWSGTFLFLCWFYRLTLMNFQRSLGSLWLPARQLVCLLVAIELFAVFLHFVGLTLAAMKDSGWRVSSVPALHQPTFGLCRVRSGYENGGAFVTPRCASTQSG